MKSQNKLILAALAGAALIATSLTEPAPAQTTAYKRTLDSCTAAAQKARTGAPTEFACDWRTLLKGVPGASISGRYTRVSRDATGTLTIIESGLDPAEIGFTTALKSSGRTCSGAVQGKRADNDALEATPAEAKGCKISIRSTKANIVRVTTTPACQHYCGLGARFDGDYRLKK